MTKYGIWSLQKRFDVNFWTFKLTFALIIWLFATKFGYFLKKLGALLFAFLSWEKWPKLWNVWEKKEIKIVLFDLLIKMERAEWGN